MRVNTVLAPALQAMHTDMRQTCFSLFVRSQDETRVHNIRLYGNTTKLAFNAPPHKRPGLCRLKRARRLSRKSRGTATLDASAISACEASRAAQRAACCPWRRQMRSAWRSSHCSRRPRRPLPPAQGCEQLALKALERVVEGGGGGGGPRRGPKPRLPTRKRANLIGLAC